MPTLRRMTVLFSLVISIPFLPQSGSTQTPNDKIVHVALLIPNQTLPYTRPKGTSFLVIEKLNNFRASFSTDAHTSELRHVAITYDLLTHLSLADALVVQDFLRWALDQQLTIWIIGTHVPDNFLELYLGVHTSLRRLTTSSLDHHLAIGIKKDTDIFVGFLLSSSHLLSLEEILGLLPTTK